MSGRANLKTVPVLVCLFLFFQNCGRFQSEYVQQSDLETKRAKSRPFLVDRQSILPVPSPWNGPFAPLAASQQQVVLDNGHIMIPAVDPSPAYTFRDPSSSKVISLALESFESSDINETHDYTLYSRVSLDGGVSFTSLKQIIQEGFTAHNPFPGVIQGVNGTAFSINPIVRMSNGEIVVPVCVGVSENFYEAALLIGRWNAAGTDLDWTIGQHVQLPDTVSSRGLFEPGVQELSGQPGTLLMVIRGSNDGLDPTKNPGYKWKSISHDYGRTWGPPVCFSYDDGTCFFSSSSVSSLVRAPNGHLYWIGNISDTPTSGNDPRYPLFIGQVDEKSLSLRKDSLLVIDDRDPSVDSAQLQLSNFTVYPDLATGTLLLFLDRIDPTTGPRVWYRIGFR